MFARPDVGRPRTIAAAVHRRLATAGSILCCHDVTPDGAADAGGAHITLHTFEAIIAAVGAGCEFVPLSDLLTRHEGGRSTAGLVALTFDDAYLGLLELRPLIERGLPITVFATSDDADTGPVFWWDRVDSSFARVTPERWHAFEDECGLPESYRRGQPPEFGRGRPLRQWILADHAGRWPEWLQPALEGLQRDAGSPGGRRGMTFDELAMLAACGPVEIGVHTRSHPVLPLLPDARMRREIDDCHTALRGRFAQTVPVLAAPFGLYDARTVRIARDCGMRAVLTLGGSTLRGAHPAEIPRFCVMQGVPPWKLRLAVAGVLERANSLRGHVGPRYPALPSPTT